MSESALLDIIPVVDPDLKLKLKLVEIQNVPNSQIPFRVYKRASGGLLIRCTNREEVDAYLATITVEFLKTKPSRKKSERNR